MSLRDEPFDYDVLVLEEMKHTQNEEDILRNIMKKHRGLPNPHLAKEKIKEHVKRPQI